MSGPGKGDKWRKNFNFKSFWDNYDLILTSKKERRNNPRRKNLKGGKVRYIYG